MPVNQGLDQGCHDIQEYLIRQVPCLPTVSEHVEPEAAGLDGVWVRAWGAAGHRRVKRVR